MLVKDGKPPLKLSRYHATSQSFVDTLDGQRKRTVYATRTGEVLVLPESLWSALEDGSLNEIAEEVLIELVDIELLVEKDEDELQALLDRNRAALKDDDLYYLVIQPTASCQLGCHYCGQKHFQKLLSEHHQNELLHRVERKMRSAKHRTMTVCWFGAEPLSGMPVIDALTPRLQALAQRYGIAYSAKIVTNGVALSEATARRLWAEHSVSFFEVTLDGPEEYHDARRMLKNGGGSFQRILKNLVEIAAAPDIEARMRIRCNVDRSNQQGVAELLRTLVRHGLHRRFGFYIAPIHSWGNDAHENAIEPNEYGQFEIEVLRQALEMGFESPLIPPRKLITCMAVRRDSDLVDASGNLFNCTEVSYVPAYGNPNKFALGNLDGAKGPSLRSQLADFNDRVADGQYDCASCELLPVCGGSCPKQWQEGLHPCPPTKFNIAGRLLLATEMKRGTSLGP